MNPEFIQTVINLIKELIESKEDTNRLIGVSNKCLNDVQEKTYIRLNEMIKNNSGFENKI